jgi:hypothetical protein
MPAVLQIPGVLTVDGNAGLLPKIIVGHYVMPLYYADCHFQYGSFDIVSFSFSPFSSLFRT